MLLVVIKIIVIPKFQPNANVFEDIIYRDQEFAKPNEHHNYLRKIQSKIGDFLEIATLVFAKCYETIILGFLYFHLDFLSIFFHLPLPNSLYS